MFASNPGELVRAVQVRQHLHGPLFHGNNMRSGHACQEHNLMVKNSEFSKYLAALGCKGGKATAKKRTPEQRKEAARKAAQARWAKEKKARKES
jgi:hypothetical protein